MNELVRELEAIWCERKRATRLLPMIMVCLVTSYTKINTMSISVALKRINNFPMGAAEHCKVHLWSNGRVRRKEEASAAQ